MKILETRRTGEEILLLSWSPKMDLLAIVNVKGELSLHRLSWQRVWQWKLSDTLVTTTAGVPSRPPGHISWHPEGLFIIVGFDRTAYILDVETGKDVHRHELPYKLQFIKWPASKFESLANTDNGTPSLLGGSDLDNDVETERTESNLSILLIGTCHGKVYAYTGGLLLSLILTLPGLTSPGPAQSQATITAGEASPGLDYFHFLVQGHAQAQTLTLVQFYNEAIPELATLLAPLGLKQTSVRNNWSKIQSQLTTLSEHWEKIVDIYTHYMTYGKTRDSEEVVADYTELLLVGWGSVELEFFLGSTVGMREKEAKKHLNTLNTGFIGISDCLSKIKQLVMLVVMDLVEIEGFLKHITRDTSQNLKGANGTGSNGNGNGIVADIRISFGQLYFVAFHLLKRTQDFFGVFRHFMRLIVNTAHVYHVTEAAVDFIEEDSDPDKVLEFLNTKVEKNIFDFLLENMSKENSAAADAEKLPKTKTNLGVKFGDVHLFDFATASETDYESTPTPWMNLQDYLVKNGATMPAPFLMDFSVTALGTLLDSSQLIPTVSAKFDKLFQIPVINSTPFCTTEYNLITNSSSDGAGSSSVKKSGMYMDTISGKTYVFSGQDSRIFLFEHDSMANTISSTCLVFSRAIHSCQFFGGPTTHLSVLSYNADDKKDTQAENGRAILCQVPLRLIPPKGPVVPFNNIVPVNINTTDSDMDIRVDVPIDIFSPGPTTSTYIDQILPIEDFAPLKFAVSGPRKVGAILGVNKRTVLLLEMDTIEGSPDEDETGTEVEDDSFDSHGGGGGSGAGDQRLSF